MNSTIKIEKFGERLICIGGIGHMFHQHGFPLGMSAKELQKKGIELSWFHVIKELYFQYTENDRLYNKIKHEIEDSSVEGISVDLKEIERFIYADTETQREMIFDFLFKGDVKLQKDFLIYKSLS
jgi:hypothetical protein